MADPMKMTITYCQQSKKSMSGVVWSKYKLAMNNIEWSPKERNIFSGNLFGDMINVN